MALLFKETPLWSIPCGSYNFIIESNVEMPAILKEANAMGVLLIEARHNGYRRLIAYIYVWCELHSGRPGVLPGRKKAQGETIRERGRERGNESAVQ